MKGDFTLSQGDLLKILVGQQGLGNSYDGGGGGGTFVVKKTAVLISAADHCRWGGGSNTWSSQGDNGLDGLTGTTSYGTGNTGTPGTNGSGVRVVILLAVVVY